MVVSAWPFDYAFPSRLQHCGVTSSSEPKGAICSISKTNEVEFGSVSGSEIAKATSQAAKFLERIPDRLGVLFSSRSGVLSFHRWSDLRQALAS
jgi:hypothetical protein